MQAQNLREEERRRAEKALLVASRAFTGEDPAQTRAAVGSTFLVLFALTAAAVALPFWPLRVLAAVLEGLTLVRAFCLFHDVQHGALLRDSRSGRAFFWLFGQTILVPPSVWRQTHNYHHAHTAKLIGSHIGSYPMLTPKLYAALPGPKRLLYRAARHPLNMVLAIFTVFFAGMCVRPFLRAPREHLEALLAALFPFALAFTCVALGRPDAFVFGWLLPLAIACALGAYLFYAQHNFPGAKVASREQWSFTGAALESSSYLEMGPVLRWFCANIGFHHVHHLNAAIPFYRLPEAMAALPELQQPAITTFAPREVLRCFHLKLWDPDAGRLVGWPPRSS